MVQQTPKRVVDRSGMGTGSVVLASSLPWCKMSKAIQEIFEWNRFKSAVWAPSVGMAASRVETTAYAHAARGQVMRTPRVLPPPCSCNHGTCVLPYIVNIFSSSWVKSSSGRTESQTETARSSSSFLQIAISSDSQRTSHDQQLNTAAKTNKKHLG